MLLLPLSAGISVDSGSDISKDAADVILLEKSLTALTHGVTRGRLTHGNTIKARLGQSAWDRVMGLWRVGWVGCVGWVVEDGLVGEAGRRRESRLQSGASAQALQPDALLPCCPAAEESSQHQQAPTPLRTRPAVTPLHCTFWPAVHQDGGVLQLWQREGRCLCFSFLVFFSTACSWSRTRAWCCPAASIGCRCCS